MPGLVPGIHVCRPCVKTWMAGTGPATTLVILWRGEDSLTPRCRAVDEQAAPRDDLLARLQVARHLHQIAVAEAGFDLAKFDRLVFVRDPQPHLIALIDQRLLRHRNRGMIA